VTALSWSSRTVVRTPPAQVIDTLTDTDACARWSPIGFSLEDDEGDEGYGGDRLRAGTVRRVSGRLLGAPVRFHLHTLTADATGLRLHARGPVDLHVQYSLTPVGSGCELDAHISIRPSRGRLGGLVARAARTLLVAGTLDDTLERIAREAERSARCCRHDPGLRGGSRR
jgi:carbon monoxide dehydrogenase subunit G